MIAVPLLFRYEYIFVGKKTPIKREGLMIVIERDSLEKEEVLVCHSCTLGKNVLMRMRQLFN